MLYRAILFLMLPIMVETQSSVNLQEDKGVEKAYKGDKGVKWTEGLSWQEVLQKAKAENKLVFVDCFTTWCGPCKLMDKNVYPDEKVGAALNEKFISVKVQMDRTNSDDDRIKMWYGDADAINKKYNVDAYPTLLFFSSGGALVHRVSEGVNVEGFLDVVSTALDPKKRYYTMLAEYQAGKKDTAMMRSLIKAANAANDRKMAEQVAEDYISFLKSENLFNKEIFDLIREFSNSQKASELANRYIDQLKEKELFTKNNIEFIRQFTKSSKQRGFNVFYNYSARVNQVMEGMLMPNGSVSRLIEGDYAQSAVRSIIYREEFVQPIFTPAIKGSPRSNDPVWTRLYSIIHKKYPQTDARRIIIDAKVRWYEWKKNWAEFSKAKVMQLELDYRNKNLVGKMFDINNRCWSLFKSATDTSILNKAIYWMEETFRQNERDLKWGTALDTYANLLYKVGRTKEALEWETKALEYESQNPEIIQALEKMKKGLPTWPILSQKPPLTIHDLGKWPSVVNPKISNDGKYVIYTYSEDDNSSLVIKAAEGIYEKWIARANTNDAVITENSQFVLVKTKDSLFIVKPSNNQIESIAGVQSYKTPEEGNGEWLAYKLRDDEKTLVVRNLITGKESRHVSVSEYMFNKQGNVLLLKKETSKDYYNIELLYSSTGKLATIWKGHEASNFCFDNGGERLAFIGENKGERSLNSLWYFSLGMDSAVVLADKKSEGIDTTLFIRADQIRFNKDGKKIFFYLEPSLSPKVDSRHISVDVWHWQDTKIQSQQLTEADRTVKFLSVVSFQQNPSSNRWPTKVIQLERDGERIDNEYDLQEYKADFVLIKKLNGNQNEYNWNSASLLSVSVINTNDGSGRLLKSNSSPYGSRFWFSPNEHNIITYDVDEKNYFSYNISTGKRQNISGLIHYPLSKEDNDLILKKKSPFGPGGWSVNGESLFVYDEYDIWEVDPTSKRKPICVTNGYGRRNKTILRFINNNLQRPGSNNAFSQRYIIGYNTLNKDNSVYQMTSQGIVKDPVLLFYGSCILYDYSGNESYGESFKPIKSKKSDKYLISIQTATEPSNYYITRNFKEYLKITHAQSLDKVFNWYTTELVTWKTPDGLESQGIFYKPDNFDSTKKYPVIIYIYEKLSQNLNAYLKPGFSTGRLNIPYFVSNGYLVFTPDINYTIGKPGSSAYSSVISAVKHLVKMPGVDSSKMGIQGHSFGGYEVNYLVTHTDLFSAAVSAAGLSNLISSYGGLFGDNSAQFQSEVNQTRIGASLWEKPDLYISNSPIFKAGRVSTPLLLMNNKRDDAVPFSQGVEMFTALRRLGKKAWMLQYDNGTHGLGNKEDFVDFTIRMKQFFDHYLKDSACPRWMLYGIPAKDKGIDNGYELVKEKDPKTGKWLTPKEGGLLTHEEKKKVEALKKRKPVTVTIE